MPIPRKQRRQDSRGFTLVETLVVMAIFAIVVMAVFSLVIPTQQSTVAQSRVADLQQGLRLAVNVMTQDLLKAGFLVLDDPITFEGNPTGTPSSDPDDFTIRTRIVGNDFGRVAANAAAGADLILGDGNTAVLSDSDKAMDQNFPNGSRVRLFDPLTTNEVVPNGVYTVTNANLNDGIIRTDYPNAVGAETVIVKLANATAPAMQTIRYRLNSGALERIVNGTTQILARDIAGVSFSYEWTSASSPPRKVRRVDILLRGQTLALQNDAISGAKERDVRTSVTLRNVF